LTFCFFAPRCNGKTKGGNPHRPAPPGPPRQGTSTFFLVFSTRPPPPGYPRRPPGAHPLVSKTPPPTAPVQPRLPLIPTTPLNLFPPSQRHFFSFFLPASMFLPRSRFSQCPFQILVFFFFLQRKQTLGGPPPPSPVPARMASGRVRTPFSRGKKQKPEKLSQEGKHNKPARGTIRIKCVSLCPLFPFLGPPLRVARSGPRKWLCPQAVFFFPPPGDRRRRPPPEKGNACRTGPPPKKSAAPPFATNETRPF